MIAMLKMLPLLVVIAGAGYGYHNVVVNQKEAKISRLEANTVTLKENAARLEAAFDVEKLAREKAEKNLQTQLKAVTELSAKNNEMQAEMDDYLSIFKRHDLTRLARAKPGLIEPRINNGTAQVFRDIEEASKEIANADSTN